MADAFFNYNDTPYSPATDAYSVVPSDTVPLGRTPKALFVGTGGDIVLIGVTVSGGEVGTTVTLKNVPSGMIIPFRAKYIKATGTTASNIVAFL